MRKKLFFFLALILTVLIVIVNAGAIEPNKYGNLIINITFNTSVIAQEKTSLEADITIFPVEDERQKTVDLVINGPGTISKQKDSIKYVWDSIDKAIFGWNAIVRTSFYVSKVQHVNFPLKIEGFDEYKKATEYIDINNEITRKANEIAAGKTDWFETVHAIGDYVYSTMTYDKSYTNSVQKASWIMENKKGVCDEYTILFMALVRALGIPTRYVSGVAYSNLEKDFGNHAWAEVYNGNEWIPFDTTFGEFGWLDAAHVALSKTADTQIANAKYRYTAPDISTSALELKAISVSSTNELKGLESLEFEIQPLQPQVKSESFIPVKVSIKNKNEYYLPLEVYIYKGLDLIGKNSRHILVPPFKTKSSFFIMKTPEAEPKYVYTATIEARTQFNDIAIGSFDFSQDYEPLSLNDAENLVSSLEESEVDYRYDASLDCIPADQYYEGEEIKINCTISSESNAMLNSMNMCISKQCYSFDLPINGIISRDFVFIENESPFIAKLSNSNLTKTQLVPVAILKKPDLQILQLEPNVIRYTETNISINIKTSSICKNTLLTLNGIDFEVGDTEKTTEYYMNFAGREALSNKVDIKAECKDLRGNLYRDEKIFDILVVDLPWYARIWQKIILFFKFR